MMHPFVQYSDVVSVGAAGTAFAFAGASMGVWVFWGVCVAMVAASQLYRARLKRR
ncbi:hypothetical protein [Streptomyces sp. SID8352]|uniref:hypothetical protein n=1 Tax=Streptomyces sp. SID8352 TaxID=2690338 RepID=UPI00137033B4|nr:hypothetical protein [Streptomyces sp. SID8352]MYU21063.1 hypothetical protein [Streptomyces sp. SID8352]